MGQVLVVSRGPYEGFYHRRSAQGDVTDSSIMFREGITGSEASLATARDTLAKMDMQREVINDLRDVLRNGVTWFFRFVET